MNRFIFYALFFSVSIPFSSIEGQNITETLEQKVSALMDRFVEVNQSKTSVTGWRIQILATNDRQRMESALRSFENLYPSIRADWIHTKPYYKIRVGAFPSKRDALRTLYILKKDYPGAYPVQDNQIKPGELLR